MATERHAPGKCKEEWVKEILSKTEAGSKMSFAYSAFLLVASIIASLGLLANSSELLIASMIISPMMGPIMALTLGATFKLRKLFFSGLKMTFGSILVCYLIGISLGSFVSLYQIVAEKAPQPTIAMLSRGNVYGLFEGVTAAILSSVAAGAVSVGKDKYQLVGVGVGISLALLPPVVNCGMLCSYAAFMRMFGVAGPASEFYNAAGVSLLVSFINILCIFTIILCFYRHKVRKSRRCCQNCSETNTPFGMQETSEEDSVRFMEERLNALNSELAETAPEHDVEMGIRI